MPKLSIIIPTYNVEKYISVCLESLRKQTFEDWEAIVVNDGSSDNSGIICNDFAKKDSRIKVYHQKNSGVSAARNFGLLKAEGEFITFVDSDDMLLNSYLNNFSYDPSLDFEVQGFTINYINHSEKNCSITPMQTKVSSLHDIYAEIEHNRLSRGPYCKLMKRRIIVDNGIMFPEKISFGEDAIFVKKYLLHCGGLARSIIAADYLYNQYENSHSLTSRQHPAINIYNAAWMDYQLYLKLEDKLGKMPTDVDIDFKYIRTLEFYSSIVACMNEKERNSISKQNFLQLAKAGMYKEIRNQRKLPPTYSFIKKCIEYLPIKYATYLLNITL